MEQKHSLAETQQKSVGIAIKNPSFFLENLPEVERSIEIGTCVQGKTLKALERDNLGKELKVALDMQILRLASSLNLNRNISESQVKTIVCDLIELYPHETMEDFIMVFKRMRQGYYGEFYSSLDGAKIISCMNKHLEEKAAYREMQHRKIKSEQNAMPIQDVIESYKQQAQGIKPIKPLDEQSEKKEAEYQAARAAYLNQKIRENGKHEQQ